MTRPDAAVPPPALSAAAAALLPLLDAASLQRLRELDPGDRNGLIGRVLDTYVASLARHAAELEQARAAGDHAALRLVAHTLKSSSASVGALALAQVCAEVEQLARDGAGAALEAPLARLEAQLAQLLAVAGRLP
jgi:HPt (histidine-containing phosphotransfer) domain-containing protein